MTDEGVPSQRLLDTLLDIRTVFDPRSALTLTLREAVEDEGRQTVVSWVALPDPAGGLVIEHVLGHRTSELESLGVQQGQGLTGRVFEHSRIHWVEEYAEAVSITHEFDHIIEAERVRRMIAAPLSVEDEVLGVLTVGRRDAGPFAERTIAHIEQLAQRASFALGVARKSRDNAAAAALAERRRISEEIHDSVSALLFSISSRTEKVHRRAANAELARELETLQGEVAEVSGMVRELVHGWHASATNDLRAEVQGGVDDFRRRTGIEAIAVFLGTLPPLDAARVEVMTRFVAVTLANVERHSTASRASVTVAALPDQLTVAVSNDGPAPSEVRPGIGLTGAEARITNLGGSVSVVDDEATEGFTIRARVPL
ncbi:GAF domain-containing sensor histidine kinase [Actinomadura coerulea]|uniref:GAF domain-containing sensor histidine kinase n=1 Tax=Actinomadura coerulea TaxID=46159 RepID=UPI0034401E4F